MGENGQQCELENWKSKAEALEKKLQKQNNLLVNIFSNFNYEIRTPMNGILGFSELLHSPDVSVEEIKMYARVIEESGSLLMSVLNDVMDIFRIEAGQYKIHFEAFDLNDLLFEIFMEYKPLAENKGLQLFLENMISEQFIIESAPKEVKRILTKLLDNALKFTKQGWIKLGYKEKSEFIVFSVEDTGIGISEVIRKNLFNSFITCKVSHSRKVSGSGLDLTLCKNLVTLLWGEINYMHREPQGSVFSFSVLNRRK